MLKRFVALPALALAAVTGVASFGVIVGGEPAHGALNACASGKQSLQLGSAQCSSTVGTGNQLVAVGPNSHAASTMGDNNNIVAVGPNSNASAGLGSNNNVVAVGAGSGAHTIKGGNNTVVAVGGCQIVVNLTNNTTAHCP